MDGSMMKFDNTYIRTNGHGDLTGLQLEGFNFG